jgi:hypothetical protein
VFENRELRKLFGPKRDEVTGEWRRLRSEKLCDVYSKSIVRVIRLRKMRRPGDVAWERRGVFRILMGKHTIMRPVGRTKRRRGRNIKIIRKVG